MCKAQPAPIGVCVEGWVVSQVRCDQPQRGSLSVYHAEGRKGLVTLGRFPRAMLRLLHRQPDLLQSHNFEVILTYETAELEERGGEVHYPCAC